MLPWVLLKRDTEVVSPPSSWLRKQINPGVFVDFVSRLLVHHHSSFRVSVYVYSKQPS